MCINSEKSDESTRGDYSCVAVNSAGSTREDARIIVFGIGTLMILYV